MNIRSKYNVLPFYIHSFSHFLTAWKSDLIIDFLVLISFFNNLINFRTNTTVMHMRRGFSNCLLFIKTHYCGNMQRVGMTKLNVTFSAWRTKSFAISMYKRSCKSGHWTKITSNVIRSVLWKGIFKTNDAFIDVFVMWLDSAAIAIVEIRLGSFGDMGDQ